jgi:hypothetical protein
MSLPSPARWRAARTCTILSAVSLAAALATGAAGAQAATISAAHPAGWNPSGAAQATNPYLPSYNHPYRHGAVPTITQTFKINNWVARHQSAMAASSDNLTYGGGVRGIGVTPGHEKVYLVFFGRQWGASGSDGHGNITLSGDPSGEAPYLQRLFKGLGTHGDAWSGVMTQFCDGAPINAQSCTADTLHVAYPFGGGVLRGVWVDRSAASPTRASGHALAVEAVRAAKHFKNTSANSNRNAQYVIVSPHNTHPDGFPSTGFCAWHDWNGDRTLGGGGGAKSRYGPIAFTNMPYLTDAGVRCGANFFNDNNQLDGVSMVAGHEYAETITDQLPPGGWLDPGGEENGDKCAWSTGRGAKAGKLTLSTGTFPMQATWGDDGLGGIGGCEFVHKIVRNVGLFNGGFEVRFFMGWTVTGATALVRHGVHTGRFAARAGRPTASGKSTIAQTFTSKGTHLSLWFNMTCPDTVRQSWATITLTDNSAHHQVALLARRCIRHSGWRKISHTVIAGHSYTLQLVNHDDRDKRRNDGTFTLLDGVTNF